MIICITGTPGSGKTYFARLLEKRSGFRYLDLNSMVKQERLFDSYDRKAKTFDVDVKKLSRFLGMLLKKYRYMDDDKAQLLQYNILKNSLGKDLTIKKTLSLFRKRKGNDIDNIIIDSHLSHYIASDVCMVMRSGISDISKRLAKRRYSKKKVLDNIQSEIFGICLEEAKALKNRIIIVNN